MASSRHRGFVAADIGLVRQHQFDASRVRIPTVTFVSVTLVPLILRLPKAHVLLPSETATAPGGNAVELLDGFLLQPTITMIADMAPMTIAFFIKRNACPNDQDMRPPLRVKVERGLSFRSPVGR